jgi:hypothetical protein
VINFFQTRLEPITNSKTELQAFLYQLETNTARMAAARKKVYDDLDALNSDLPKATKAPDVQ